MSNSWRLAIDFGTSNSAAAHQVGDRDPQTLPLTHQGNLMPSAVFFTETEAFAGHAAINHAGSRPDAYLATPKRAIDHPAVRLGGKDIPTPTVFAAVIRQIVEKAKTQHNGTAPEAVVLTHPEAWSSAALKTLIEAARQSGIAPEQLSLISEPRAAAYHYSKKNNLQAGEKVAVFDFGGGTLDVAVLSPSGDGTLQVIAARGDNSLGGRNIDSIIKQWVMDQLDENNTPFYNFLMSPDAGAAQHNLDLAVRSAKEVLSDAPSATISISGGGFSESLLLTRQEFENLISTDIARAMDLTRATLLDAGLRPDQTTLVYLTGGSARIPYIQNELGNLAHVATLDDPKTVVCRGALMGPTRPATAILEGNLSQYINPGDDKRESFRGEGGAGAAGFVGSAAAGAGMMGAPGGAPGSTPGAGYGGPVGPAGMNAGMGSSVGPSAGGPGAMSGPAAGLGAPLGPGMSGPGRPGAMGRPSAPSTGPQPSTQTHAMSAAGLGRPQPHTPPGGFPASPGDSPFPPSDQQQAYATGGQSSGANKNQGNNGISTGAKAAIAIGVVAVLGAGGFGLAQMGGGGDSSGASSSVSSSSTEPGQTSSGSAGDPGATTTAANGNPLPDEALKLPRSDDLTEKVAKLLPAAFANTLDCYQGNTPFTFYPADNATDPLKAKEGFSCRLENEELVKHFDTNSSASLYVFHDSAVVKAAMNDFDKKDSIKYYKINEYSNEGDIVSWGKRFEYSDGKMDDVELLVVNKKNDIVIRVFTEFNDDQDTNAKEFAANSGLTTKPWG